MTKIALATAAHYPDLSPDDQVLAAAMRRRAIDVRAVIWDADVDWSAFDVVVVRSIWDYHLKYEKFVQWLNVLDASGARVHNPTAVLRWNSDKRYLSELEQQGIAITPTRIVMRDDATALSSILADTGWQTAVVKPTVSSTGYETWNVTAPCTDADEERFARQTATMSVLVQEFAQEVKDGEYSFVFIAGSYLHGILKRAAPDEFRVHIEHGGTVESFDAAPDQIAWAKRVIAAVGDRPWTYARVDAVAGARGMKLMELEMLDPELFFKYRPDTADTFIDAIVDAR